MQTPRVRTASTARVTPATVAERRITGRALQRRRFSVWTRDPHCARCGRLCDWPHGFELDHIIPLDPAHGGQDTEENTQILCTDFEDTEGCHSIKTREDRQK